MAPVDITAPQSHAHGGHHNRRPGPDDAALSYEVASFGEKREGVRALRVPVKTRLRPRGTPTVCTTVQRGDVFATLVTC